MFLLDPVDFKADEIIIDHAAQTIERHDTFNNRAREGSTHIVKLSRGLLPAERRTKEETPVSPESGVRHDIDLKNRET
jgi:hypothetical protein